MEETKKFYVTMIRRISNNSQRVAKLAGPYDTHEEALSKVDQARTIAYDIDPRSHWDSFGTSAITAAVHTPGTINHLMN